MIDSDIVKSFRKSPIEFIRVMWHLIPQPLKPEYVERAKICSLKEFKKDWFQPFIKGKHITWQQWVALLAVEKAIKFVAPKRITIGSGHGIGKDAFLSWVILWFLFCFEDAQVPCTAPTSGQLHDILWKEISKWISKMPEEIAIRYLWSNGYVRMKDRPETWFARARTADKENPEALAGIHGDHVLIAVDEASGVPDQIYQPAEGALTNENVLVILISNTTRLIGYFFDTHHGDKLNWQGLNFSSEDSPIVEAGYPERIAQKFGRDSDQYRYMVLGQFPKADSIDDKGYVSLLVETDIKSIADTGFIGVPRLGVDPAGLGKNETVWVARDNFKGKVMGREKTSTGKSIALKTITLASLLGITKKDAKNISIDGFGIGLDAVKELALLGWDVNAVNVGEAPHEEKDKKMLSPEELEETKLYLNKRAMVYDRIKKWLRKGGELITHPDWKQLLQIKYLRTLSGKMQIMSKKDMAKAGIESPDTADALSLTFLEKEAAPEKPFKKYVQPKQETNFESEGR